MTINNNTTRRQWLRRTARYGFFATIAAAAASLLHRSDSTKETPCVDPEGRLGCRNCSQLNNCGLPRALSVKQHLENKHGHYS